MTTTKLGKAIDFDECPRNGGNKCRCEICRTCGWRKHVSLHGPYWKGLELINEPYHHEFVPSGRVNYDGSVPRELPID